MTLVFGAIPPIAIVFALPFLLPSVPAEKVDLIKWFFSCPFPPLRFSLLLNVPAEKVDLINNQMVFPFFLPCLFFLLPSALQCFAGYYHINIVICLIDNYKWCFS